MSDARHDAEGVQRSKAICELLQRGHNAFEFVIDFGCAIPMTLSHDGTRGDYESGLREGAVRDDLVSLVTEQAFGPIRHQR